MQLRFKESNPNFSNQTMVGCIERVIAKYAPPVKGWDRTVSKDGVLTNGSVAYYRETSEFQGCLVCFITSTTVASDDGMEYVVNLNFTGWLAEWDQADKKYYSWGGSFISNYDDLNSARVALRHLADQRRATRDF